MLEKETAIRKRCVHLNSLHCCSNQFHESCNPLHNVFLWREGPTLGDLFIIERSLDILEILIYSSECVFSACPKDSAPFHGPRICGGDGGRGSGPTCSKSRSCAVSTGEVAAREIETSSVAQPQILQLRRIRKLVAAGAVLMPTTIPLRGVHNVLGTQYTIRDPHR
ncbi:hypothetical protein BDM02DRAFT_300992 [Thelephora ganbajun]|uniref:Uncharacterized protein n=1 Tax=Thelephora ganbajun TaxID=370292 RepID=A0ACB6Z9H8_THEGA|nr:hypothetical protein BDM02DRAFT_300992 [Thelephora ganbajun]